MTNSNSIQSSQNNQSGPRACPDCRVGNLQATSASFFTDVAGNLMTIPDFPAWVCDICGYREYDRESLHQLQALLSTEQHTSMPSARVSPSCEIERPAKGAEPPKTV